MSTIERQALMDCHVHIDEIEIHDPAVAQFFGKHVGDSRWPQVPLEHHLAHIRDDNIDTEYVIYEHPESLTELQKAADCDVRGMYFVRDVHNPDVTEISSLYAMGLVRALKVHPVIDHFELTTENLTNILNIARNFSVPILFHSDDRSDQMHLTSPELQRELADQHPDITFIIGHGGAYAHPRLVGSKQALSYWFGEKTPYSRNVLVSSALWLSLTRENVYYDLTIATNKIKASLIADFVNTYPKAAEKILIGTDFPINHSSAQSQLRALLQAGVKESLAARIAANRLI